MRRKSREYTLQSLYEWQLSKNPVKEIETRVLNTQKLNRLDVSYFKILLSGVIDQIEQLDKVITQFLDRPINQLNPIELNILRIGAYELLYQSDVPFKVVINEALELEKKFGAEEGYKYVNGVLDQIAKKYRSQKSE